MGCDIHMMVQKRLNADSPWETVELPCSSWWHEDWHREQIKKEKRGNDKCYDCKGSNRSYRGYSNRNYDVFAVLANVRNGYGFAGVDTGDGYMPISEPKGLPDDIASDDTGYEHKGVWLGDHSHSWLLLSEIRAYDFSGTTNKRGWVNEPEYAVFKEVGSPSSWCGGVSGRDVQHVNNDEMDALISGKTLHEKGVSYYTNVQWRVGYGDALADFLAWADKTLGSIEKEVGAENVRLVFGFDS